MIKYFKKYYYAALCFVVTTNSLASSYNIGTGGGTAFNTVTTLFQDWVDFMLGPFGKVVVVFSLVSAVILWVVLPKGGIMPLATRAVIAGAVLLNFSIWMGWLGG